MKRLVVLSLALLLAGCTFLSHPVDSQEKGFDHRTRSPRVLAFLGQAQQICLPEGKPTVPVDIFVVLQRQPPSEVKFIIDDDLKIELFGESVQLHLEKVALGPHHADIYVNGGYKLTLSWTVWACGAKERQELYKPDGSGLKGYCDAQ